MVLAVIEEVSRVYGTFGSSMTRQGLWKRSGTLLELYGAVPGLRPRTVYRTQSR